MKPVAFRIPALAAALLLAGCDFSPSGGNGSETTNQFTGVVKDPSGRPAVGVLVRAVPRSHNPLTDSLPTGLVTRTDSQGRYVFPDSVSGEFNLEFADSLGSLCAWQGGARLGSPAPATGDVELRSPGALRLGLPEALTHAGGHIVLPGTTVHRAIGEGSVLLVDGLPEMRIPSVAYALRSGDSLVRLLADVPVASGKTTSQAVPDSILLPGEALFGLNTLPSGAAVAEDVRDFALLIRLDSGNFDFALSPADRSRLHFRDRRGIVLSHEVERWDSLGRRADIWVHLDSLAGNSGNQTVRMVWGRSAPSAAGLPVFAKERGYDAVLHFSDGGGAGDGGDSRANASDPLRPARILYPEGDEGVDGLIGGADSLDAFRDSTPSAVNDVLELGRIPLQEFLTVSAWVRLSELPATHDPMVSHGKDSLRTSWSYALSLGSDSIAPSLQLDGRDGLLNSPQAIAPGAHPIRPGAWTLVQGTFDGTRLDTYVNGSRVSSVPASHPGVPGADDGTTFFGFGAGGVVDELRIERTARPAAWLRLSYENQKPGQSLVKRLR